MRHFALDDFKCSETGKNAMDLYFLDALDELREQSGFPFKVNSGYRSPTHSIEAAKDKPGVHSKGIAADIAVNGGNQRHVLVSNAVRLGFTGIGIAKTFIHVDTRPGPAMMWSY